MGPTALDVNARAALQELTQRLDRYPSDRYPIQHATARFHVGVLLTNLGRLSEAQIALDEAMELFDSERLPTEHAKARNALGAVHRLQGRLEAAEHEFRSAGEGFETLGLFVEAAAAHFNLGLVQREKGEMPAALETLDRARQVFEEVDAREQFAHATREVGATLLSLGRVSSAIRTLEQAVSLAERMGDLGALGAAWNSLGLAYLAAERANDAARSFRAAAGAHPRGIRPLEFAMAKANLAGAYEQLEDAPRARLAALQAVAIRDASPAVLALAQGVISRLGRKPGDLPSVLVTESEELWPSLIRDEMARWVISADDRLKETSAWIDAQVKRKDGLRLSEAFLTVLLELPADDMEVMIRSFVQALVQKGDDVQGRWRTDVAAAMVRFPVPQWMRLKDTFERVEREFGRQVSWN